jgi:hypothetical protein
MPQNPAPAPTPFDIIDPTAVSYPMLYSILWLLAACILAGAIRYLLNRFKRKQKNTPLSVQSLINSSESTLIEEISIERLKSSISLLFHYCEKDSFISSIDKKRIIAFLYQHNPLMEEGKSILSLLIGYSKEKQK